ncbi:MAG: D-cysteine desulfhydrase family protein [Clostridia bacterium]|nr:D-cysteine desulfhydrase family protein [Clostridia bacterium]
MNNLSFPDKIPLGIFPTPIQRLGNISEELGANIFIKRDDMTGVALGGNKVRKLEYLLYEAKKQGAEVVFTTGGAQSNHAMLTAACSNKIGMTPILILKKKGVTDRKGNQLLESLMGTEVRFMDTNSYDDIYREMDAVGAFLKKPYYKIPCGGSNALGTIGYVDCVREIAEQGFSFDRIICAEGSGGTMAGLALGAKLFMPACRVTGMMVDTDPFEEITVKLMREAAEILNADVQITKDDFDLIDMCGPGYAIASKEGNEAVSLMAEKEGVFLDPVYTGKAFAGLIQMAKEGRFRKDEKVLFLHSGGAGGLFAVEM